MKTCPSIAIIFPILNNWKDSEKCLLSIKTSSYPQEKIEIIVVDNASTDESVKKIGKYFPRIRLLLLKNNLGFAQAINRGAKIATSDFILITNNDIIFEKDCLKELAKTLISCNSQVGAVGGKVKWENKEKLGIDGFRLNPYLAYHQFDLSNQDQKRETDWISGNCFLTTRKLFLDLGGFDKNYFFYFEDIDFCLRLKKKGLKLLYNPLAIAYHGYGKTILKESYEKIFYLGYRSRWHCVLKNANPIQILFSSFFLLTLFPLYQTILTHRNIFKPMLKGLLSNFGK